VYLPPNLELPLRWRRGFSGPFQGKTVRFAGLRNHFAGFWRAIDRFGRAANLGEADVGLACKNSDDDPGFVNSTGSRIVLFGTLDFVLNGLSARSRPSIGGQPNPSQGRLILVGRTSDVNPNQAF
jgi:hypothetical protein